jgi:hypothetical protein
MSLGPNLTGLLPQRIMAQVKALPDLAPRLRRERRMASGCGYSQESEKFLPQSM